MASEFDMFFSGEDFVDHRCYRFSLNKSCTNKIDRHLRDLVISPFRDTVGQSPPRFFLTVPIESKPRPNGFKHCVPYTLSMFAHSFTKSIFPRDRCREQKLYPSFAQVSQLGNDACHIPSNPIQELCTTKKPTILVFQFDARETNILGAVLFPKAPDESRGGKEFDLLKQFNYRQLAELSHKFFQFRRRRCATFAEYFLCGSDYRFNENCPRESGLTGANCGQ